MESESVTHQEIQQRLQAFANEDKRRHSEQFFQSYPGGYGEGDSFRGVTVPNQRSVANDVWHHTPLAESDALLDSPYHEDRLTAVHILVKQYASRGRWSLSIEAPGVPSGAPSTPPETTATSPVSSPTLDAPEQRRRAIFNLVVANIDRINNWDIVDTVAPKITGPWLLTHDRAILETWAASGMLWRERMAMMSTFAFLRAGEYEPTLALVERFLNHPHDLMHKAAGWMLREVGKRDQATEERFLDTHYHTMPRTMLRYAIEKFDEPRRLAYLRSER